MKWIRHKDNKIFHMYDPYLERSLCNEESKPRIHDAVVFTYDEMNVVNLEDMCEKCKETYRLGGGIRKFLEG